MVLNKKTEGSLLCKALCPGKSKYQNLSEFSMITKCCSMKFGMIKLPILLLRCILSRNAIKGDIYFESNNIG